MNVEYKYNQQQIIDRARYSGLYYYFKEIAGLRGHKLRVEVANHMRSMVN